MHALARTCGIALALSILAPLARPATITFTRIADTTTAIPAGTGAFTQFGSSPGNPVVPAISGNNVLFAGMNGAQAGVYLSKNGALSRVADRNTPVPSSAGTMENFWGLSVEGDNVAFYSSTSSPQFRTGIYKNVGAGLVRVADNASGVYGGFSSPVLSGGNVYVFADDTGFAESIVTDAGGSLHTLVASGSPVPGTAETFGGINTNVGAANGDVAFFGSYGAVRGIYRTRNGTVERVADSHTLIPGSAASFANFSNVSVDFDGTDVVFVASDPVGSRAAGVYRTLNGALAAVAVNGAAVPGYGAVDFPSYTNVRVSIDNGRVAFTDRSALFTDVGGSVEKVVGAGDTLFGKTIAQVLFGSQGLSGNTLAFLARFTDGTSGIYAAQVPAPPTPPVAPVPLPPALLCGTLAGAWTLLRKERRRR